jgi:hypothetical protein
MLTSAPRRQGRCSYCVSNTRPIIPVTDFDSADLADALDLGCKTRTRMPRFGTNVHRQATEAFVSSPVTFGVEATSRGRRGSWPPIFLA